MTRRRRLALALVVAVLAALGVWTGASVWRSRALYDHAVGPRRGWHGRAHAAHGELGYAPVPGASALHTFPLGDPLPMRYDERGFRAPVGAERTALEPPLVLALGCSFTYGDACLAEHAFPHRVAAGLGGTALNAGVCGWGLAQMLIRARELVPRYRPDYVLVQDSPWLLNRALSPFRRDRFARTTVPYFVDGAGGVTLHAPVWRANTYDLPVQAYFGSERSASGFASFLLRVGLPLFAHDDLHAALHGARSALGLTPPPTARRKDCLDQVWAELAALCRAHGGRLVVLRIGLGSDGPSAYTPPAFAEATVVDGHAALWDGLGERTQAAWERAYGHWRGDPPRLVDRHPNPRAHALLAEAILDSL